jgi:S-adenosylmethionine-diacylglycerol 3-amino-3-carboxypropyl transferase
MPAQAKRIIEDAVIRKDAGLGDKLLDKAFALAFKGLVYAQIWEDPVVDIQPDSRVMCIASGSCNALSYLTANPESVTAVDLNKAHVALGQLKIAAIKHLPNYERFHRFFAHADHKENSAVYKTMIAPHLDPVSRAYWEKRDIRGRKRISYFTKGIYKKGLLGNFIGLAHVFAKLYKIDLGRVLEAQTLEEQREVFERELAPVFEKKFIRWLTDQPASLFGLGIPPAQFSRAMNVWPKCFGGGWKSSPVISRSRITTSPGRPSGAVTAGPRVRRFRPIFNAPIGKRCANGSGGST